MARDLDLGRVLPRAGAIADGSNGDIACDHYHRLEADLDLIADLGVTLTASRSPGRASSRLGTGAVNAAGLAFYERLVDGLLKRNIRPYATLYHWDLPAELQRRDGGWLARDTAYRFADYARSSRSAWVIVSFLSRLTTSRG